MSDRAGPLCPRPHVWRRGQAHRLGGHPVWSVSRGPGRQRRQVRPPAVPEAPHAARRLLDRCGRHLGGRDEQRGQLPALLQRPHRQEHLGQAGQVGVHEYSSQIKSCFLFYYRPGCGEKEILRVLWCFTLINCGLATLLALEYKSVYEL